MFSAFLNTLYILAAILMIVAVYIGSNTYRVVPNGAEGYEIRRFRPSTTKILIMVCLWCIPFVNIASAIVICLGHLDCIDRTTILPLVEKPEGYPLPIGNVFRHPDIVLKLIRCDR